MITFLIFVTLYLLMELGMIAIYNHVKDRFSEVKPTMKWYSHIPILGQSLQVLIWAMTVVLYLEYSYNKENKDYDSSRI